MCVWIQFVKKYAFFLACAFLSSANLRAEVLSGIYSVPVCQEKKLNKEEAPRPRKAKISRSEIQSLKMRGDFPFAFDNLDRFVDRVDNWKKKQTSCQRNEAIYEAADVPKEAQIVLADLTKKTKEIIAQDIRENRNFIHGGELCSKEILRITQNGKQIKDIRAKDFSNLTSQTPNAQQCEQFAQFVVPDLSRRLKLLRELLSVATTTKAGSVLKHDGEFVDHVSVAFLPNVWKKNSLYQLSPLAEKEKEEAMILQRNIPPALAMDHYYQILSTSPLLVFFDQEITPEKLHFAFSELKRQDRFDLNGYEKSPPQDMMLKLPYLVKALETLPEDQLGDACLVVDEVYKNLILRYEKIPQLLNRAPLILALGAAALASRGGVMVALAAFGTVMMRGGALASGASALLSAHKYAKGVSMCSTVVIEDHILPQSGGYGEMCDFKKVNSVFQEVKSQSATAILGGTMLIGSPMTGRLLDSALSSKPRDDK